MKRSSSILKLLRISSLVVLILLGATSLGRLVQQTFSVAGGNDLYTYWYAGHFIREGKDFYKAFINDELPRVPVRYLDREVDTLDGIVFPGLVPAPASTSPVFFLLAPLAFLSWPLAKATWLVLNLSLLAFIPFLIVGLFRKHDWLTGWEFVGFTAALLGLTSTRYAAASGQITFLILDFLLATLYLASNKPWIAGFLLGMALSKYSLALGILILFIFFEPKVRLVIAAGLVQFAGIVCLMFLSGSGFMEIISEYIRMAFWHAGREGIHLAAALNSEQYLGVIALALTLAVGIPLIFWRWKIGRIPFDKSLSPLGRYHLAVILILWVLLVGYHRAYDAMVVITFFGLIVYLVKQPNAWRLSKWLQTGLVIFSTTAFLLLMVPSGSVVRGLLPQSLAAFWGEAANLITTALISIFLIVTIALLYYLKDETRNSLQT
jgi:hypothetical protein